jgi:hypothetical protein
MKTTGGVRPALAAMYVGLALTLLATLASYLGQDTLADHVRDGYPDYSPDEVDSAVASWLAILTIVGVLGAATWIATIRVTASGKAGSRWAVAAAFVVGTVIALAALLTEDTSGDVGLAPEIGWIGTLPSVAGAAAVVLVWRGVQPLGPDQVTDRSRSHGRAVETGRADVSEGPR